MTRILVILLLALLCGASSCQPDRVALQPVPPPAPIVVEVPTYVALPREGTKRCAEPQERPVKTDLELWKVAMAWMTTALCNGNKLDGIAAKQPEPAP